MDDYFYTGPGDMMFELVPIFIFVVFIVVIGGLIFSAARGFRQWNKNEKSPKLNVNAVVKSKRTDYVSFAGSHQHPGSAQTDYYVTFEFDSGDRSEFKLSGKQYGILSEGDTGQLTFQGTRYLSFNRERATAL
ncbi:Protein of unknown function [Amphibacillus marinus]|uniref:DUF2500 domain-containing protein n=1 Tax=Amphibacillus marinus TaxID=872970 RepID=A0A1H8PIH0_9BACI|nr:DUF2500 domain-containing protein [Amphibacillus marinus]SEO41616.1 Protein of unknown function [Amphibacillus marinus]